MNWFSELTGLTSDSHKHVWDTFEIDGPELVSRRDARRLHFGTLSTPSLSDLRVQTDGMCELGTPLVVRQITADAARLHRDPANAGALFQVASQFNLLEMISPDVTPEDGISGYAHDKTQGPVCAMACGAGTLFRNYFAPFGPHHGQLIYRQLDMARDLELALGTEGQFWHMKNGYLLPHGAASLSDLSARLAPDHAELMRIGLQSETHVTGTSHRVTQAYCSAVPVSYCGLPAEIWAPLGRMILNAAYEATLHGALLNRAATGSGRVFLTHLGGGAFGNPLSWIHDAMLAAFARFARSGLEVVIVTYREQDAGLHDALTRQGFL